jgi:hypothetical protein
VDVSVEREGDGRFLVQLAGDEWELAVRLTESDLRELVRSAHWSERGTMRAGESAGGLPVFWASDGDQARLLIGRDGEAGTLRSPSRSRSWMRSSAGLSRVNPNQTPQTERWCANHVARNRTRRSQVWWS